MFDWEALGAGFAFYLILEGLMPLLNPEGFKRTLALVLVTPSSQLRFFGAIVIISGIALLYWVR
ncbi:MAG: DUF2065 domain-containing protein [Arenicella sp.]